MKLDKCLKIALNMVAHSPLRSWLTIVGIVIGVASVIAIVSLGNGLQNQVNSQLSSLNANLVTLSPGFERGQGGGFGRFGGGPGGFGGAASTAVVTLGKNDVRALQGISEISLINAQISGRTNVSFGGESGNLQVSGVDPKTWSQITSSKVGQGRFLEPSDKGVVVIGYSLASGFFKSPITLGKDISIEGKSFKVIGITSDTGRFDRSITMPIDEAYSVLSSTKTRDDYDNIQVVLKDGTDIDAAVAKITTVLMSSRNVKTQDFTVSSTKDLQQSVSSVTSSLTLFLTAIAAVSLLVGAVGIANSMFTSVLEKTKEIGIMKAVGAKNRDIMTIFLFNAGLIGLVGGLLGVALGTVASSFMSSLLTGSGISLPGIGGRGGGSVTLVSVDILIGVLAISVFVGLLSGAIPAYQASKLKPVDALRYE